jgi:large-conductance mechanosensitive channel
MHGQYWLSYFYGWAYWFLIPLLVVLLIVRVLSRRNWRKIEGYYKKSWANQDEMIALLKEIRDSLKK